MPVESLASYQHCLEHLQRHWSTFLAKREARLAEAQRYGSAAEKVAENILEDLFTVALDWSLSDINHQIGYADLVLTRMGIKHLVVEVKRPGALAWNRLAVEKALAQAQRYADEQRVRTVAVSDGCMLYVADIEHGGLQDRVFVNLAAAEPHGSLWWLSVQGIYRPRTETGDAALRLLPEMPAPTTPAADSEPEGLLHPKYKLPARCFGYVGNAADIRTWKLPYCNADGTTDLKRLPKAIQAILTNYRGVQVAGIPEAAIPDVLVRLGGAAAQLGRMPHQSGHTAEVYQQLAGALEQLGRLTEVISAE
ncbi:MAG: hypothetical protein ABSA52_20825 [Candidatus Binatia bacterium]|jgi:hypothetical protein